MVDFAERLAKLSEKQRILLELRLKKQEEQIATRNVIPCRVHPEEPAPLSFAQQRLWFLEQILEGRPVYHVPLILRLEGSLDCSALERALQEIVQRHEVLRTTFGRVNEQPVQIVAPDLPISLLPV